MKTMQEDTMICVAWKDRQIVHILFNNMDPRELGNVTRREKDGRRKEVRCSKVADTYSKNKGGVDIAKLIKIQDAIFHMPPSEEMVEIYLLISF